MPSSQYKSWAHQCTVSSQKPQSLWAKRSTGTRSRRAIHQTASAHLPTTHMRCTCEQALSARKSCFRVHWFWCGCELPFLVAVTWHECTRRRQKRKWWRRRGCRAGQRSPRWWEPPWACSGERSVWCLWRWRLGFCCGGVGSSETRLFRWRVLAFWFCAFWGWWIWEVLCGGFWRVVVGIVGRV